MAHPYYGGAGHDPAYRPDYQSAPHGAYYDRPAPYIYSEELSRQDYQHQEGYHHHYYHRRNHHDQFDEHQEHYGRPVTRGLVNQQQNGSSNGQQERKRVSLACSRCRKRKIKCSGKAGDDEACTACKSAGTEGLQCQFKRAGTLDPTSGHLARVNANSALLSAQEAAYAADAAPQPTYGLVSDVPQHRASLSTLQAPSAFPLEPEWYHNISPIDAYYNNHGPTTITRQDSLGRWRPEDHRTWNPSVSMPTPRNSAYYESRQSAGSFGSMLAPSPHQLEYRGTRLPSVTHDSDYFMLNHMNASLPAQAMHNRRLPVPPPHALRNSQLPTPVSEAHAYGTYAGPTQPRLHMIDAQGHGRPAQPWSSVFQNGAFRLASAPAITVSTSGSSDALSQPTLSDQFDPNAQLNSSGSPQISPTSARAPQDDYASSSGSSASSMLPPMHHGYASSSLDSSNGLPSIRSVSLRNAFDPSHYSQASVTVPELYSFRTEAETPDLHPSAADQSSDARSMGDENGFDYCSIYQAQPQHATNEMNSLHRTSSHEQQRAVEARHRMSFANINGTY